MTDKPAEKTEHYFSAQPSGEFRRSRIDVRLAGRDVSVETAGGIFSPDHIDAGTQTLIAYVPAPPAVGHLLDIGCGWGPLALTLALESPEAHVHAIDVNERALELTSTNAQLVGASNVEAQRPENVPTSIEFAVIWSNPPIRAGKAELHSIMRTWIPRLAPGASAWLVIAKHLGADSFEKWLTVEFVATHTVERAANHKGFRVIEVHKNN